MGVDNGSENLQFSILIYDHEINFLESFTLFPFESTINALSTR